MDEETLEVLTDMIWLGFWFDVIFISIVITLAVKVFSTWKANKPRR